MFDDLVALVAGSLTAPPPSRFDLSRLSPDDLAALEQLVTRYPVTDGRVPLRAMSDDELDMLAALIERAEERRPTSGHPLQPRTPLAVEGGR